MSSARTPYPRVFWVANIIEVLERFAYYGIYFGFGIYMASLGFSRDQLGWVQSIFLLFSYTVPLISGTFADRFGFKKMLIVSYCAYLPTILMLIFLKSFSGIALTMLCIGLSAGIFKPLIAGTVRVSTDSSNKTMGFGIFYAMVNLGGSLGPIVAGYLRKTSWDHAFMASAAGVFIMLLITIFFYKEPPRQIEGVTLKQKFKEIGVVLSDLKFSLFLFLVGAFFWLPFWAFFNLCAIYVDKHMDTAGMYVTISSIPLIGYWVAQLLSHEVEGVRHIMGETVAHTGWIILLLQIPVSRTIEKYKAMPTFMSGLAVASVGFVLLGLSYYTAPWVAIVGIIVFAVGEMMSSPRLQEYITWIAPKEKAGLYMGTVFLSTAVGAFCSGFTYTSLFGYFEGNGNPDYVWYVLAAHYLAAIGVFVIFGKVAGTFEERTE